MTPEIPDTYLETLLMIKSILAWMFGFQIFITITLLVGIDSIIRALREILARYK